MPMQVFSNKLNTKKFNNIDIAGFTCIESDYIYKGYTGQLSVEDYVVFSNVGSYSIVFKPQFILPNVPIIEHNDQNTEYEIIKRQETMNDVFSTFTF
jgi:diaminopimelate decarboxylase